MVSTRVNCPVHVYAEAKSTLNTAGATAFGNDRPGRDSYQQTARSLAPVHAYAELGSTLRTTGGAPFGTPRKNQQAVSRPSRKTLPTKLLPLPEIQQASKVGPQAHEDFDEDGNSSPRDIE